MPNVVICSTVSSPYNAEINRLISGDPYNVEITTSPEGFGTLLVEMKYTGYACGSLAPYSSSIDGFYTSADYGYAQMVTASAYGTNFRAGRFPQQSEAGGTNNSRYAISILMPRSLRNSGSQLRFRVYHQSPATGSFAAGTPDSNNYLFCWGGFLLRHKGDSINAPAKGLIAYSASVFLVSCSYAATTGSNWYIFDHHIKMSDDGDGFYHFKMYNAFDNSLITSMDFVGNTGKENVRNALSATVGQHIVIYNFVGTTFASNGPQYFPAMGPIYVYNTA